jgi:hypothetical protein
MISESWLGVDRTFRSPSSTASQAQPLPKTFIAESESVSLNLSKLPNFRSIALPSAPLGWPPPPFFIDCQNRV